MTNWKVLIIVLFTVILPIVYCCIRIPEGSIADKSPADGRYVVSIVGNPQNYEPGQRYNISLKGIQAIPSPAHTFIGFMLAVENENAVNTKDPIEAVSTSGIFDLYDYHETKFSDKCPNLVTHTNTLAKSKIQVVWIAPAAGSGCVNFRATVIEHRDVWYMDDGLLTKQFCEEQQDDVDNQPPIMDPCCACDEAKYELTFEGKWSRHTHPKDFPANSWTTRFSDIIGASHTIDYRFWKYGELASDGLRDVAEHGSTRKLESELKDQSEQIRTIIKARGIAYPNVTGKTFAVFRVDSLHHLISLVSKIDPSPDWIVGVSALELCLPNCSWVEYKEHNLYPWDTGTDSGPSYMSADQAQVPPDVIRRIKSNYPNDPRSPFYDPTGQSMKPLAKIYISRRRLYEKKCDDNENESDHHVECATNPWTKWTECNSKCGPGKSYRNRVFKSPDLAKQFKCRQHTREDKDCIGQRCNQPYEDTYHNVGAGENVDFSNNMGYNQNSPECAMTDWEPWTECSNNCGKGTQTTSRSYINPRASKMCQAVNHVKLSGIKECYDTSGCSGNIAEEEIGVDTESEAEVPIHDICYFGEWSEWSPCNPSCGYGARERRRDVVALNTDNSADVVLCKNYTKIEREHCRNEDCIIPDFCYVLPEVGACRENISNFWYYSYTSDNCGIFVSGDCQPNDNKFNSKEKCEAICKPGKKKIEILEIESLRLEKQDCKVSDWHTRQCNVTCGEGYQIKTRNVLRMAKNGGKPCPKKLVRVDKCFVRCQNDFYSESLNRRMGNKRYLLSNGGDDSRSNDCLYSEWSHWSPCTTTCGNHSVRQKTRTTLHGGTGKCKDRIRVEKCNVDDC